MGRIFASVMNKVLLSIGSNEDREANIALCHKLLDESFEEIHYSGISITSPYGTHYKNDFLNQLAITYTHKEKEEISLLLKSIEKRMGRKKEDKKKGVVKIDIDLISWNEDILRPAEISRSYIADLLPELEG
jgi:2-amino-4-hydroxy-6-hydroxymethyldihydropteridine diphosphokinase